MKESERIFEEVLHEIRAERKSSAIARLRAEVEEILRESRAERKSSAIARLRAEFKEILRESRAERKSSAIARLSAEVKTLHGLLQVTQGQCGRVTYALVEVEAQAEALRAVADAYQGFRDWIRQSWDPDERGVLVMKLRDVDAALDAAARTGAWQPKEE